MTIMPYWQLLINDLPGFRCEKRRHVMIYYYFIAITIVLIFVSISQTPKFKGWIGEMRVHRVLRKIAKQEGGLELHDFMFEDDISSSQIDNMLLTKKALYVLEVKNYSGYIFGSETQTDWTMTVKHVNKVTGRNGKIYQKVHISKHSFYNPIMQNQTHIRKIKNLTNISEFIPIYNVIVFGRNALLKDVSHSPSCKVLLHKELFRYINSMESQIQSELSTEKQMEIVDMLFLHNITDKKRRKKHVKDIRVKYNK